MWGTRPEHGPQNGAQNSGFFPPLNTNQRRNMVGYSYGSRSHHPEPGYAGYYRTPNRNYPSRPPPLYGNYPGSVQNSGGYMASYNPRAGHVQHPSEMSYQSNGIQRTGSFFGSELQSNGSFIGSALQRNGSFMGSQLQRSGSFMGSQLQRSGSFMGSQFQRNGSFGGSQLQRTDSWMQPYSLQANGSMMGSSNQLTRGNSSNGFDLQPYSSFGVDSLNQDNGYSGDFGTRYVGGNRRRDSQNPPPADGQERQGLALLLRKQSVLHKGGDVGEGDSQIIGRRGGGLVFKGIEE
ncbi:hypothetical protein LSM04_005050 [Trypanosoma melophagium]|uniref:uncharacterized protein n=1 Tax=Trypanosoma melophagium TaxID=715481 RepID=UPI00351A7CA9|nr:hypothetical protein LSM04_005050 [Trypanosoma melophagium]